MNDMAVQLVIQAGAIGICALLVVSHGRKMDRLAEAIYKLVQRVEILIDRDERFEEDR